jgi:HK97 family phage major capsid protein
MNQVSRDFYALKARMALQPNYERRSEPDSGDLADTIGNIAEAFESFKSGQASTVAELRKTIERMELRMARPGAMETRSTGAFDQGAITTATREERAALSQLLRTGDRHYANEAKAAINAGTTNQGLETVAPWFDDVILKMARANAPLLGIVRQKRVSNFPAKHIVGNGTQMGSGWAGEQGSRGDTEPPLPLVVEVPAGEWWALPSVTEWALSDLNFDVLKWLQDELVSEYSETMQAAVVAGNGSNKPTGFLAGPTPVTTTDGTRSFGTLQYFATGQAATLPTTTAGTVDMLLDVVHGTRWQHRQKASWVMSALTMSALRKFKDADGRPILLDSMITGEPTKLLGYPLIECEFMPSIGAGAFPIAFGDFDAGYVLDEDADGMRITRDDVTQKGFIKFYARRRVGGKILDSEAIKLVKVAAS